MTPDLNPACTDRTELLDIQAEQRRARAGMDPATLEALKGSIRKWEKIVDGTGKDAGSTNCPLCLLFNKEQTNTPYEVDEDDNSIDGCEGCPVRAASGRDWCYGTPYKAYVDTGFARYRETAEQAAQRAASRANHAQAELDFLRSLLPNEVEK